MELAFVLGPEPVHGCAADPDASDLHRDQSLHLAAALAQRGHRVTLWTASDGLDLDPYGGVEVMRAPTDRPGGFAEFLARHWSAAPPQVAHAGGLASSLAVLAAAGGRVPLVQDVRGPGPALRMAGGVADGDEAARMTRLARAVHRRAEQVLAANTDHAKALQAGGLGPGKVSVLPFGVDEPATARSRPAAAMPEPGRGGRRVLVCPDGLDESGGAADVIRALPWLLDAHLIIAGGPDPDALSGDPDAVRIRRLARSLGLSERVRLTGRLSASEMTTLYRGSDITVTVPRHATAGITCLEAMAAGACVVASSVGTALDAVLPDITGVLVAPGEPRRLASTLRGLLAHPARVQAYGVAAADRARARYSWPQVAHDGEQAYRRAARADLVDTLADAAACAAHAEG